MRSLPPTKGRDVTNEMRDAASGVERGQGAPRAALASGEFPREGGEPELARIRTLLLALVPPGAEDDVLATVLTEADVVRHLRAMGHACVPPELASWFAHVPRPVQVGPEGHVLLLNLPSAVACAGMWKTMRALQESLDVDVDTAPYFPVATSGGLLWCLRLEGADQERVVRTNVANVFQPAFPSLLAALEHWSTESRRTRSADRRGPHEIVATHAPSRAR